MSYPRPIYLGQFDPVVAGDTKDEWIQLTIQPSADFDGAYDLAFGEAISSVAYTVVDASGATVAGAVSAHSETATRSDFRYSIAAAGGYVLNAAFTIDDGQKITRTAGLWVV